MNEDLVSIYEIADMAGVTPPAVGNWRKRYPDFPKPIAELRSGPIFQRQQIKSWLRRKRVIIPTIPDVFSTYGIPQIVKRVRDFSGAIEPIRQRGLSFQKRQPRLGTKMLREGHSRTR